nr:hypothetical transcript [Hymenolepis microstoma]
MKWGWNFDTVNITAGFLSVDFLSDFFDLFVSPIYLVCQVLGISGSGGGNVLDDLVGFEVFANLTRGFLLRLVRWSKSLVGIIAPIALAVKADFMAGERRLIAAGDKALRNADG